MNAVEYKNLLYISASNSYNDLCVTKNCIYNLCKNKTNVLWKQVNTISDSINSTIDKTISCSSCFVKKSSVLDIIFSRY